MDILRWLLCLGLVFHKLLWEVLKRKGAARSTERQPEKGLLKRAIKGLKALVLACVAFQTLFLDLLPISDSPIPLKVIGTTVYVLGLATAVAGRLQLGDSWIDLEDYQILRGQTLVTDGIYRFIRHPIYVGDVLLLVGLELALNSWLVLVMLIPLAVAVRQALAEEMLLSRTLPGYDAYCRRTKRFIPFIL
jgi:protein-S-isoprenylcysteine O-methyltransferase Ste14